jgi:hypothetical protein
VIGRFYWAFNLIGQFYRPSILIGRFYRLWYLGTLRIYIYKEECLFVCLFVCLFAMRLETVWANATKLSGNYLHIQGKVDIYFFSEKNQPSPCYRRTYATDQ